MLMKVKKKNSSCFHVFKGLGCVEGEYNIKLKAKSHPTIQPQRNVPLRLIDYLKGTLDNLNLNEQVSNR